jgi:hypothetical protein
MFEIAWKAGKRNGGVVGVDKVSVERFEVSDKKYLEELSKDLKTISYALRRWPIAFFKKAG